MVSSSHYAIRAIVRAGQAYSQQCKGKKPSEHKLGPPAPHFFKALLESILKKGVGAAPIEAGDDVLPPAHIIGAGPLLDALKALWATWILGTSLETLGAMVSTVRIGRCYDKSRTKLTISLRDAAAETTIIQALKHQVAELMLGRAPAGGHEVRVKKALTQLKKKKEDEEEDDLSED